MVCGDLTAAAPAEIADIYYPVVFKSFARLYPPLQWRGGALQELFKKGSESNKKDFRDGVLADDSGKSVSKYIRTNVLPLVDNLTSNTQYGSGLNGGETAIAHLHARLFLEAAIHSKPNRSSAIFFLDVSEASLLL